eukprot:4354877-Prymnesium_polylepis.1
MTVQAVDGVHIIVQYPNRNSNRCTAIGTIEYNVGNVKGGHGGVSEVHQGGQGVPCHARCEGSLPQCPMAVQAVDGMHIIVQYPNRNSNR